MAFQGSKQFGRETEIALHEIGGILGTVHARKMKNEIAVGRKGVEFLCRVAEIVFVDLVDRKRRARFILAVTDILQVVDEGGSDHALRPGHEDLHRSFLHTIRLTIPT